MSTPLALLLVTAKCGTATDCKVTQYPSLHSRSAVRRLVPGSVASEDIGHLGPMPVHVAIRYLAVMSSRSSACPLDCSALVATCR